jgi:hypothetical protein
MASWGTCYSGTNNIHFNSPPIMSDGRNYSSWQPEAKINKRIQHNNDIKTNWEYRQFLQKNGIQICKQNFYETCKINGLPYARENKETNTNYGYPNSDLKSLYLTREQLQSKLIAPTIMVSEINKLDL